MRPFTILLLLFFTVPLIEIFLLIEVGGIIGPLPTVFLVVFTAVLGAWLIRIQGFSTLARIQSTLAQGGIPAIEMLEGAVLLISGALLLTPGFFTDAIGFCCLVPSLRRIVIVWAVRHVLHIPVQPGASGPKSAHHAKGPTTIEGEYRREDD